MLETLRQPKWLIAGCIVLLLAAVFVRLGFWQLGRLEERQLDNQVGASRLEEEPVPLEDLLAAAGDDLESVEYRRAIVSGDWSLDEEVLIRSQVELGSAGFHVITPLVTENGSAVLVNRGWVPLTMDSPPIEEAAPQQGARVEGWVHLTELRPPLGAEELPGELAVFNRVDIDRIAEQVSHPVAPVYLVAVGEGDPLPIPPGFPDFDDDGPHLAYAIQWFAFALVGLVGFYFLARSKGRARRPPTGAGPHQAG